MYFTWLDELDIILFTGDAYIDHPSFGPAVIGRSIEAAGYRIAIVPQPDWHGDFRDLKSLETTPFLCSFAWKHGFYGE